MAVPRYIRVVVERERLVTRDAECHVVAIRLGPDPQNMGDEYVTVTAGEPDHESVVAAFSKLLRRALDEMSPKSLTIDEARAFLDRTKQRPPSSD